MINNQDQEEIRTIFTCLSPFRQGVIPNTVQYLRKRYDYKDMEKEPLNRKSPEDQNTVTVSASGKTVTESSPLKACFAEGWIHPRHNLRFLTDFAAKYPRSAEGRLCKALG